MSAQKAHYFITSMGYWGAFILCFCTDSKQSYKDLVKQQHITSFHEKITQRSKAAKDLSMPEASMGVKRFTSKNVKTHESGSLYTFKQNLSGQTHSRSVHWQKYQSLLFRYFQS